MSLQTFQTKKQAQVGGAHLRGHGHSCRLGHGGMDPSFVEVALLSGRSARLRLALGSSLEQLLLAAERELGVCIEQLITPEGDILQEGVGIEPLLGSEGRVLTAQVRAPQLIGGQTAFALVKSNGSIVTWGLGGVNPQSPGCPVRSIQATSRAFAAILSDGTVMTWGGASDGGSSQHLQQQLQDVKAIQASERSFAAIRWAGI